MKPIFFFLVLLFVQQLHGQIIKDSLIGTWEHFDKDSKSQKLVITSDSVTVIAQIPHYPDNKTWDTISYTGKYTIIDNNTLHVIYWDDPREEQFYEILYLENGTMLVQLRVPIKKKHGDPKEYRKQ